MYAINANNADQIAIVTDNTLQVWQWNAGQTLTPTRCQFLAESRINTLAFYRSSALAIGTTGGEVIAGNWQQNQPSVRFQLSSAVEKILYDDKNSLFWVHTENALFIYPNLDDAVADDKLIKEVVRHLFPWQVYPGYSPVFACAISQNFSHIALWTASLDLLLFRLP